MMAEDGDIKMIQPIEKLTTSQKSNNTAKMTRRAGKKKHRDDDKAFEAFLKESMSSEDSLDTARVSKYLNMKKNERKNEPWWMKEEEEEDDDDFGGGLTGTGKSFLKKKKDPPTVNHSSMNGRPPGPGLSDVMDSKDSLDDVSLGNQVPKTGAQNGFGIPALSFGSTQSCTETMTTDKKDSTIPMGMDTVDELEDKKRFFKELEGGGQRVDYRQLNKELDNEGTLGTLSPQKGQPQRKLENDLDSIGSESEHEEEAFETSRERTTEPTQDVSPHRNSKQGSEDGRPSMLSKVALLDSLDSTLGKRGSRDTREGGDEGDMGAIPETTENREDCLDGVDVTGTNHQEESTRDRLAALKTDTCFGLTETSNELEALQRALRNAGMSTLGSTLPDPTLLETGQQHDSTTSHQEATGTFGMQQFHQVSDKPSRTVEDILREVQELEEGGQTRGFDLQPAQPITSEDHDEVSAGHDISPLEKYAPPVTTGNDVAHPADLPPSPKLEADTRGFDLSPVHSRKSVDFDLNYSHMERQAHNEASPRQRPVPSPRTSLPHKKKKTKTKRDKYGHVRSSGYGAKSSSPAKSPSKTSQWSPVHSTLQKVKGTEVPTVTDKNIVPASVSDSRLMASVESFARYIQDHYTGVTSSPNKPSVEALPTGTNQPISTGVDKISALDREQALVKEVREWQDQWKEERKMHAKVKADMENKQRDLERQMETLRMDYEKKMFTLKQENFVLSAKVTTDAPDGPQQPSLAERLAGDGVSQEQLEQVEKEVREQEKLLAGYQQENERLYQELKKLNTVSKTTEQRMFTENQRLTAQISTLKSQLEQQELELRNKGLTIKLSAQNPSMAVGSETGSAVLGAGRIAQLEAQFRNSKAREEELEREIETLKRTKQELEEQIDLLVTKMQEFQEKVNHAKDSQGLEVMELKELHGKEMEKVNRKLKWYAENQELLDRDADKLRLQEEEIKKLKATLDGLSSEVGKSQAEAKARIKEKSVESRKIRDLERQVKEMEGIIKKRHPNSLPVLMWAAAAATDTAPASKSPSSKFLEERVQKLDKELEEKDEEAKRSIRVLEQKYNVMKFQYEERIDHLEAQLAKYEGSGNMKGGSHPHTHVQALQTELENVKKRHRLCVADLEAELETKKKEVTSLKNKDLAASKSTEKQAQEAESDAQLRVKALQTELANQVKEKQLLQATIERLQGEKGLTHHEGNKAKDKGAKVRPRSATRRIGQKKLSDKEEEKNPSKATVSLPPYSSSVTADKEYTPTTFSGLHIDDVLREKEHFKLQVEQLKLDIDQQRVLQSKALADAEARGRLAREDWAQQMSALRNSHQMELQRLMTEHAVQTSTSKVTELQGKLDAQEVLVQHLKQQQAANLLDAESLSALKIKEAALETQVTQLLEELREAKRCHTPEMRHFDALQEKIKQLENRYQNREQELQQILRHSRQLHENEIATEVAKWKKLLEAKNHETEKFRTELDSILHVLKELQRQGVVLPQSKSY